MDLIEIEEALKLAIETENWEMVKKAEKELFRGEALDNLLSYGWEKQDSDLRNFFKSPNRRPIDFIYLFHYDCSNTKNFLDRNLNRIYDIMNIIREHIEQYDKEHENAK